MTMYIFRGHQKKTFGTSVLNIVRSKGMILDKGKTFLSLQFPENDEH